MRFARTAYIVSIILTATSAFLFFAAGLHSTVAAMRLLTVKESLSAAIALTCAIASLTYASDVFVHAMYSIATFFRVGVTHEHFKNLLLALAFMLPGAYAVKELGLAEYAQHMSILITLGVWMFMSAFLADIVSRLGRGARSTLRPRVAHPSQA